MSEVKNIKSKVTRKLNSFLYTDRLYYAIKNCVEYCTNNISYFAKSTVDILKALWVKIGDDLSARNYTKDKVLFERIVAELKYEVTLI